MTKEKIETVVSIAVGVVLTAMSIFGYFEGVQWVFGS
jgi:hypothetical protein